jgi:hypothetical protein
MSTAKPLNAFTIGYGGPPIKLPPTRKKHKSGLVVSPRPGPIPILRPAELAARKLALKSKL